MKYTVYHKSQTGSGISLHKDGPWFFEPAGYDGGDVFSAGYPTKEKAATAAELLAAENDEDDPEITINEVDFGWGIADGATPDPSVFVDGPLGKSIQVYGYSSDEYWDFETGKFLGPDEHGIVPVWTDRKTGSMFPPHAKVYPHLC